MYFCVSKPNLCMRHHPVQGTMVSYVGVIVSVTLVLLLMGIFGYALIYGSQLARTLRESIHVIAELKESVSDQEAHQVKAALEGSPFIKPSTVQLISREEAARAMKEEVGEHFEYLGLPNPYFDIVTFNVPSAYMHPDSLSWIRTTIMAMPAVSDVFYQENLSGLVSANMQKITWASLAGALLLIFAAITLIHNTIRLALHANRFTIKNMELVGATWGFISRPFLRRSFTHGLVSSGLAAGALWLMHWLLSLALPQWNQLMAREYLFLLFGLMTIMGVAIQLSSTFFIVRKYLKLRVDDLF
jgi:cell division transport system permease protein